MMISGSLGICWNYPANDADYQKKYYFFSLVLNFAAIVFAVTGLLSPVAGALVHNAGSVAVIISSALLLKWRCHNACCSKQNKKLVHCAVHKYVRHKNENA